MTPAPIKATGILPLDDEIVQFSRISSLSPREGDVLRLLLSGVVSAGEMGKTLGISPHTVNNHLTNIFEKTATASKTEIVSAFVRHVLNTLSHCRMFTQRPKVLVVDEETEVARIVSDYLTKKGLQVLIESDPRNVAAIVREAKLDFVVSDFSMPIMSGTELLRAIRAQHRCSPMMIMVADDCVTPPSDPELGAVSLIAKPLDLSRLFFMIMEHFIECSHERSRLLRIDAQVPVLIDGSIRCETGNLGYGGLFLPFDEDPDAPERRLKAGDEVALEFWLPDRDLPYTAGGEVAWRRLQSSLGVSAGVGIRFTDMSPESRAAVEDYVRLHKISAFIPLASPRPRAS